MLRVPLALGFLFAGRAAAQVSTEAGQYKGWRVEEVRISGLDPKLAKELQGGLALTRRGRLFEWNRVQFMPAVLEEDLARVRLFMARHGYPDAQVEPQFEPQRERRRLRLTLQVDPGPRVRNGEVLVEGGDESLRRELAQNLPIKQGDEFSEEKVQAGARSLAETLRARGYALAKTSVHVERVGPTTARVVYRIEPGAVQFFGDVVVEGIAADLVPVARRTTDIRRGKRYEPEALERADENLRLLSLFRRVQLTVRPAAPDTLDVHCDLEERDLRSLHTGFGFWSDELLRVEAGWEHRNMFKKARGLAVKGSFSYYDQHATLTYWRPALFASRTRGSLNAEYGRRKEESFESQGVESEVALTWNRSFATTVRLALAVSYTDYTELSESVETGEEGWLSTTSLAWNFDKRDDPLWPSSGLRLGSRLETGLPGPISESHFVLLEAGSAVYAGPPKGVVVAARLEFGIADPTLESEDLVADKRFFAGGATSMRGFDRHELGPKDAEGLPLGGEAKLETSAEVRFPLIKVLYGAVFVDAGQVWSKAGSVRLSELEVAVGGGIMLKTPIGALRFDTGYRLTYFDQTQPRTAYHFLIGNPF